jgi:DNA-binding YbaB/EbfC family protein
MKNLGKMMAQAHKMQSKMQDMQAKLNDLQITGDAGAGMVKVTLTGKGDLVGVNIDPSLLTPDDVETLEDLLVAAFRNAKNQVDEEVKKQMSEVTGGIELPPGMNLPF